MQQQFGNDVNFVGVAGRDSVEEMLTFVNDTGVNGFSHIADADGEVWGTYGVTSQPAFVFINDDGSAELLVSSLGLEGLTERVEALVRS